MKKESTINFKEEDSMQDLKELEIIHQKSEEQRRSFTNHRKHRRQVKEKMRTLKRILGGQI